jgi:hypothetical protein
LEPISARSSDTAQQLAALRDQLQQANPLLYRHWALYLQVLRDGLQTAVDKACFHQAVVVNPQRYRSLQPASRLELHRRLASLVQRCCSLLTVEQLAVLANQMQAEQRRRRRREQQRWLQGLQQRPDQDAASAAGMPPAPSGSIHLGLDLPIAADLFGQLRGAQSAQEGVAGNDPTPEPDAGEDQGEDGQTDEGQVDEGQVNDELMGAYAELLEQVQFAQGAESWLESSLQPDEPDAEPRGPALPLAGSGEGLMPSEPLALLLWLEGLESALARRLRNLSHALNVELLRLGVSPTLLPLNLLEAIVGGHLETQNAPANLVRLPLPLQLRAAAPIRDLVAVLIRPADLEVEQLPLRTCRSRIQQARQEVRRMAQTYQRLEARLQALDAEQLWLSDHSTARSASRPPTA